MYLEVTAVPDEHPPARLGERFTPRPHAPLRIGPGREARVTVKGLGADVEVASDGAGLALQVTPASLPVSVSGQQAPVGVTLLQAGDALYVHPGLAFEVRERPPVRAREPNLEARLAEVDDDAAWAVYADFLEERGDPLAAWIRSPGPDHARQLGALAAAERSGALDLVFSRRSFLVSAGLSRSAVLAPPHVRWYLAQLSTLPLARFLRELDLPVFAGSAAPPAPERLGPDALAADLLERLARADFAPALRRVSLGYVDRVSEWPLAQRAFERLRAVATHLEGELDAVVRVGARAQLVVASQAGRAVMASPAVTLNPARSDVGTAPTCLVRLVGDAPPVACSLHRTTDGQWVVFDERADPFSRNRDALSLRVNQVPTARATLQPGDLVEPVPGLVLRLVLS